MASNSGWTTLLPSGQSTIQQTDDEFRSFKSFMEAWWEQEHYATSGSASSAGVAKHGAGRAFKGTASQLSNPTADNDGRLFFVTDDNVLRIGNVSTSSWSVVADNVTLSSANSWTGLNEFSADALNSSGATLGPPRDYFRFSSANITSSASVQASRFGAVGVNELALDHLTLRAGAITGIAAVFNANITAGSLEINPSVNRAPSAYSLTLDASSSSLPIGGAGHTASDTTTPDVVTFAAGDWITCYVAGDASLSPSGTGDVAEILVEVTYDS